MANKAMDLFLIYQFLKRLVQPFDKWDAYKTGVIDKNGKVVTDKRDRTSEQKRSWGYYDRLIANMKKLLAKVPGGRTRLASFAAALVLLKEQDLDPDDTEYLQEALNFYMDEALMLTEDEGATNTAGGGAIAAIGIGKDGEPGYYQDDIARHKKKNKILQRRALQAYRKEQRR